MLQELVYRSIGKAEIRIILRALLWIRSESIKRARAALKARSPLEASEIAEKALEDLSRRPSDPALEGVTAAIRASLMALFATSRRRVAQDLPDGFTTTFCEAEASFERVLASPNSATAGFVLRTYCLIIDYLVMLVDFGFVDKAIALLNSPAAQGLDPSAFTAIGASLSAGDESHRALEFLRTAISLAPTAGQIIDLGSALERAGEKERALAAYLHAATTALDTSDQRTAARAIERAATLYPGHPEVLRARGAVRWRAREFERAVADFEAALKANEEDLETRVALIRALLDSDRPEEALEHIRFVSTQQPDHPDLDWLQGEAELTLGDVEANEARDAQARQRWETALGHLSEGLAKRPENGACRRSRGIALFRLGPADEALREIDAVLRQDPNDARSHGWRAAVLLQQGKSEDALSAANLALALVSLNSLSTRRRAWLLALKGMALLQEEWPEQAKAMLLQAHSTNPADLAVYRALKQTLEVQGDWSTLIGCIDTTLVLHRNNPLIRLELCKDALRANRNLGSYPPAFAALHRASPGVQDDELNWLHARLHADVGNFEAADTILQALAGERPTGAKTSFSDRLSLAGWTTQNLEPEDKPRRQVLAMRGVELYREAFVRSEIESHASDPIWLRKGLANALLRTGIPERAEEAAEEYRTVIRECSDRLSSGADPAVFSLMGWCYHCRGEHDRA